MSKQDIRTVLVSGANGFLGKELVRQLMNNDYYTIALTSQEGQLKKSFGEHSNLDIQNIDNWAEEIGRDKKIDVLINCAFPRTSDPSHLASGLNFTEKLIKDSIGLNIHSIINISSQSVYSQKVKSLPDETAAVAPESLYGMTKYASEKLVSTLCENSSRMIYYSNIRLASLMGMSLDIRMTNKFVKKALKGETITINGGSQKISYLEVRDAASALIAMLNKNPINWNSVYNLGSHYSYPVLEVAEIVEQTAEKHSVKSVNIEVQEGQNNFNNLIDSNLFYRDFEWEPYYDVPLMVNELFEHYKNRV